MITPRMMHRRDAIRSMGAAALGLLGGCAPAPRGREDVFLSDPRPAMGASRPIVSAQEIDFDARGRRDYFVRLEHPTLWASYLIPVTVMVGPGAQRGRGLVAIGSTHGDEYEGPLAIKRLLREIPADRVEGRLILIPVLNVMAFKAGRRETPDDGVNLNRAFPGDAKGGVSSRLADFVSRFILPQVHVVLDIHSGGEVARFALNASFHPIPDVAQRKAIEETARGFGTKFVLIYQNLTQGLLTSHAESLGKIVVGSELGWGRSLQVEGVAMARQGILTAAIRHGQLKGEIPGDPLYPAAEQVMVDTSDSASSLLAPFEGHFEPRVPLGAKVARGQRIGSLHDFNRIDDEPLDLHCPHDGYILCQAWGARVIQGQVLTQVGRVAEWTR